MLMMHDENILLRANESDHSDDDDRRCTIDHAIVYPFHLRDQKKLMYDRKCEVRSNNEKSTKMSSRVNQKLR